MPRPRPGWRAPVARFSSSPSPTGTPTGTQTLPFIHARPTRISWLPYTWPKATRVSATPWSRCSSCSISGRPIRTNAPISRTWCRSARSLLPGLESPSPRPAWQRRVCSGTICYRAGRGSPLPSAPRPCPPPPGSRMPSAIRLPCRSSCKVLAFPTCTSGAGRIVATPITRLANLYRLPSIGKARCPFPLGVLPAACWSLTFPTPAHGRRC